MRKSVTYGLVGFLAVCVALAGAAAVAWRVFGLDLVESLIAEALADRGVPVSALTLRSVGTGQAVLTDLRLELAGGVTIRRVEADYRLADLIWDRRVDRLLLSGIRVDLAATAGSWPADAPLPDAPLVDLPIGSIVVQDGEIAMGTPLGLLILAVELEAIPLAEGRVAVSGRARVRGDSREIGMSLTGGVISEREYILSATLDAGRVGWRGAILRNSEGNFTLSRTESGTNWIEVVLAADVTMPDGSAARLDALGQLADGSGGFNFELSSDARRGRVRLNAAVQGWGQPSVAYDLKLDAEMPLLGRVAAMAGADIDWISAGMVKAGLSGVWDRAPGNAPAPVDGRLVVEADLRSAETGQRFTMDLTADLRGGTETARLKSDGPARLSWQPDRATGALALTFGGRSGSAFDVALGRVGNGWTLAADGPFRLADRNGLLSGSVDLTASGDKNAAGQAGRLSVDLSASGSVLGAVAVDGGRANLAGNFSVGDGHWRLQSESCQTVAAERLTIGPRLTLPNGLSACLSALPDRPLLEGGAASGMDVNLVARADPVTLMMDTGAAEGLRIELGRTETTIASRLEADGAASAEITMPDAELRLPDEGIALDRIALVLKAATGAGPALRLSLESATLRSFREPDWIVPLRIAGDAVFRDDDLLEFQGNVQGAAGAITAAVDGRHDRTSGAGQAHIQFDPVSFAPGVRQPADIAPALGAELLGDVVGNIAANARIGWGERLSSSGELRVENLTLTSHGATVRGVEGTLRADSLLPLNLPDGQLLAFDGADLGLVLEEGAMAFGFADDRLTVQGIGFSLAGGSLAVEPFQAGPDDPELQLVVTMRGVELGLLSAQFPIEGLTVTGRLDGEIPIRLFDDTISIDNGVLETTEPGVIRYIATLPVGQPSEGGVGLLIGAVRNFHYEGLRATLNGRTGDDLEVAVRLTGANPDLYDGYPIALNINLSGELEEVLRSGLNSMAIADDAGSLLRGE